MCGINGVQLLTGKLNTFTIGKSLVKMKHRGPDDFGTWASNDKKTLLGQSRLAIVDPQARSNQPMIVDNGNFVVAFNGEIYNYKSLREKLTATKRYTFKTTSDTEVLLRGYCEFGVDVLKHIEGMFAFAIYDRAKNILFCARDQLGQKPFVYSAQSDGFYFASEIPALAVLKPSLIDDRYGDAIDVDAIKLFMTPNFKQIPAPFTAFTQIKKLEPGNYLIVRGGKIIEHKQYYHLEGKRLSDDAFFSILDEMKPSDVTYATLLSGGVDSSLVGIGLAQTGAEKSDRKKVHAYTLKLSESDPDYLRATILAKRYDFDHTVVPFKPSSHLKSVSDQVKQLGEPYLHMTSVYADALFGEVAKKHKVVFTGAGGDEVYYGYNNTILFAVDAVLLAGKIIPSFLLKLILPAKYSFLASAKLSNVKQAYYLSEYDKVANLFADANSNGVSKYYSHLMNFIFGLPQSNSNKKLKRFIDVSYLSGLFFENSHSLTIQGDLIGMKHSLEVRSPFLEKRIIEDGYSRSTFSKILLTNPREGKKPLRRLLLKFMPGSYVYAKKKGFGVDFVGHDALLSANQKEIRRLLGVVAKYDAFDKKAVLELQTMQSSQWADKFEIIYKLCAVGIWLESVK